MIEFVNAISTVLLLLLIPAVCLLRTEHLNLTDIWEKINSSKDVLEFISRLPRWLQLYNNLKANVRKLREKTDMLQERLNDLRIRVENEEFRTGRRRKREVDNWLNYAGTKCGETHRLLQAMARETNHFWKFLHQAWLGNLVERKIQEVNDLYNAGSFEVVLAPVRERADFVTTPLVGMAANENINRILAWLRSGVTKIGVHGIKGIGKSVVMMHIHNQLSDYYDYVYYIPVPDDHNDKKLQKAIADALEIDLQEEDEAKRAVLLYRALQQRKFVLILMV